MKRWILFLLAALTAFSLAACGKQQTDAGKKETTKKKEALLRITNHDLLHNNYSIVVSKDNADLLKRIDRAITDLKEKHAIQKIERCYLYREGQRPDVSGTVSESAKVLTVGTCADLPPYVFVEEDEIVGIDMDVAALLAEKLGMKLEIVNMPYDAIVPAVVSGKIDIGMAGIPNNETVPESVAFSKSYSASAQAMIVSKDSELKAVGDIYDAILEKKQVRIGVLRDSLGSLYAADQFARAEVQVFDRNDEVLQALLDGEIDCAFLDEAPANYYIRIFNER